MSKVLVFGTFDVLHPGHLFTLSQAKKYGDTLVAVIARDATVKQVKGFFPEHDQTQRMSAVLASGLVDEVHLGREGDKYAIIEAIRPDTIVLGYDQSAFVDSLQDQLQQRSLHAQVIRLTQSYQPHKYKSSLLRQA